MFVLRLLAFSGAGITYRGTDGAKIGDKARVTADECGAFPAQVRAINTKPGAFRHLAEALIAARFTLFRASGTSFHA
jgi:hypothetical protein